jgi:GxxExxY protein
MDQDSETGLIIGAAMEVHRTLGAGFLEAVYQEALELEFCSGSIPFKAQHPLPIHYKGKILKTPYRADFLCFDSVIVEIKAPDDLTGREKSQLLNFLKASGCKRRLFINFGSPSLQFKRMVF